MNHQLDQKEAYFYGLLVALAKEQQTAQEKLIAGNLNRWGKSRVKSRTKEVQRIMLHLFNAKNDAGVEVVPEILNDLSYIETNTDEWTDVKPEEIEYLRGVLSQVA